MGQKVESGQKIYASRGWCEMYIYMYTKFGTIITIHIQLVGCCSAVLYYSDGNTIYKYGTVGGIKKNNYCIL